jgi:hypothetical protein
MASASCLGIGVVVEGKGLDRSFRSIINEADIAKSPFQLLYLELQVLGFIYSLDR